MLLSLAHSCYVMLCSLLRGSDIPGIEDERDGSGSGAAGHTVVGIRIEERHFPSTATVAPAPASTSASTPLPTAP